MVDLALSPSLESIGLTTRAAHRIRLIIATEGSGSALRIAVEGGGCSGFQYRFAIADAGEADDVRIEADGVTILIDQMSLPLLAGSTLDFKTDLMGESFRFENPNATANCGCGTSFSI